MSISLKQAYDLFIFDRATYCKQKTIQNYLHLANTYERMGSDVYKLDGIFFRSYYSRGYAIGTNQRVK